MMWRDRLLKIGLVTSVIGVICVVSGAGWAFVEAVTIHLPILWEREPALVFILGGLILAAIGIFGAMATTPIHMSPPRTPRVPNPPRT